MESESRFESDVPTLESVCANIARLKRKIHDKTILTLRSTIGNVKGLDGLQIYVKFKSAVMNLHESCRLEKSSWPMFLLEIFTPHSVDSPKEARSQEIIKFHDIIIGMECELKANESNFSECNESVQSDVENEESQFYEIENSNQQSDNMHNVSSSSYDGESTKEE